ncbi:MAG: hypothetical protein G01um101448_699 [Parcubacteria group bacterium Gr01-1014_48]|nr:MAG: hypothetical protein G01um101448_699 [Parcubacteria group bacterium Gr01-1014_48]
MGQHKKEEVAFLHGGTLYAVFVAGMLKTKFERDNGEGSLAQLFALLMENCNSFAELGKRFGRTREAIRQLYVKYLVSRGDVQPDGTSRRRVCTLNRIHVSQFPESVLKVWRMARRAGIHVNAVNSVLPDKTVLTLSHTLFFNDVIGQIYVSRCTFKETSLARVHVTKRLLERFPLHIALLEISGYREDVYILPSSILLHLLGNARKRCSCYLPLVFPDGSIPERKRDVSWLRKYDWTPYINAWDLIHAMQPGQER